nr:hypothetical protein [Tanacetum cinerariifolium]
MQRTRRFREAMGCNLMRDSTRQRLSRTILKRLEFMTILMVIVKTKRLEFKLIKALGQSDVIGKVIEFQDNNGANSKPGVLLSFAICLSNCTLSLLPYPAVLRFFVVQNNRWPCIMSSMVKEKQEKDKIGTKPDKIGTKPDKNGKRGKAQQCQRPIAVEKAEKRGNTDSRDQF